MTSPALDILRADHFIAGRPVVADQRFEVRDPGRVVDIVASVGQGTAEHVDRAVEAARASGPIWSRLTLEARLDLLTEAVAAVRSRVDELATVLTRENGGTVLESSMDLSRGLELFTDFLGRAPRVLAARTADTTEHWLSIEHQPIGVTALIVPWNSPVVLTLSKLAPALIAGNTVVVKPSVLAPVALGEVLRAIGEFLPDGTVNVVHGDAEVGEALVAHRRVRMVSFTGSVAVGRQIMAGASGTVKRIGLELGGNDPALLLDDVDIAAAASSLGKGMFTRAGQICFAVKRVYAPRASYDDILEALSAEVATYRVGHGLEAETTFGPLITAEAKARVEDLTERAAAAGGVIHELGSPTDGVDWSGGHFLLPRLVSGLDHEAELVHVEQFGPVVPVVAYDDLDQAISMANDSEFALCSSVWSSDVEHAVDVARRLEAGGTFINSHNVSSLSFQMPFGGQKQSGLGRERTDTGLMEYVEEHAIRLSR